MTQSPDSLEQFIENARAAGFEVTVGEAPVISGAEVSEALYGLADSGSVVLAASMQEPRGRSLLPDVHISLLAQDRIISGLSELFELEGSRLPSVLAIVTGPSRSSDIEQKLTIGVHGPREEYVVVIPTTGRPSPRSR